MRKVFFEPQALEQFKFWEQTDMHTFQKILQLIDSIQENPFRGLGKPEPLKYQLKGYWSRRINSEHRLIYKITEEKIIIINCRFHY